MFHLGIGDWVTRLSYYMRMGYAVHPVIYPRVFELLRRGAKIQGAPLDTIRNDLKYHNIPLSASAAHVLARVPGVTRLG